jgi:hypothetical protein
MQTYSNEYPFGWNPACTAQYLSHTLVEILTSYWLAQSGRYSHILNVKQAELKTLLERHICTLEDGLLIPAVFLTSFSLFHSSQFNYITACKCTEQAVFHRTVFAVTYAIRSYTNLRDTKNYKWGFINRPRPIQ